jgi:hypothetical protein
VRRITSTAILIAICVVGRVLFQFIPSVQPVTSIVLLVVMYRGLFDGILISSLTMVITGMYFGMGHWVIGQIICYVVLCLLSSMLFRVKFIQKSKLLTASVFFLSGIVYGFVISCVEYKLFGFTAFLPYYLAGISFDVLQSIGNLLFFLLLSPILMKNKYFYQFISGSSFENKRKR